jgi:hypothetical protein
MRLATSFFADDRRDGACKMFRQRKREGDSKVHRVSCDDRNICELTNSPLYLDYPSSSLDLT